MKKKGYTLLQQTTYKFETTRDADEFLLSISPHLQCVALTNLFFLAKDVLGYDDLNDEIHRPLCDIVQAINPVIIRQAGKRCALYHNPNALKYYNANNLAHSLHTTISNPNNSLDDSQKSDFGGGGGMAKITGTSTENYAKFSNDFCNTLSLKELVNYKDIKLGRIMKYVEYGDGLERLFLLHRGCFKTTVISIAHTIQLMLLWPEIRILLNSHKKEKGSMQILGAIRTHFMANSKLRALFRDCVPQPNKNGDIEFGTQERVVMPNRLPECAWPEATVEVSGFTTDVTGRHYDYIKNDDLVTRDSVTNESMIQKTREIKALQTFLFNQPEWGITDNIGTIYHFNDLWCDLDKMNITKVKMPVWDENEEIVFKERFTKEGIQKIKDDLSREGGNDYEFSCQYLLNPIPPASQTFKREWLERDGFYYTDKEIEDVTMRISIYIDPANSRRKSSDYTAWFVLGVDSDGTKYLLDIGRDKLSPEDRTNKACDLCEEWGIHRIHYETIGFQDTDKYIIDRKMRERKWFIEVIEIKASNQSKQDRIRGLQPLYERGDIRWPKSLIHFSQYHQRNEDMIRSFKDEMFMFPKCIHDDMLDVHSFMLRVPEFNASRPSEQKSDEDAFDRLRNLLVNQKQSPIKTFRNKKPFQHKRYEIPAYKCVI